MKKLFTVLAIAGFLVLGLSLTGVALAGDDDDDGDDSITTPSAVGGGIFVARGGVPGGQVLSST